MALGPLGLDLVVVASVAVVVFTSLGGWARPPRPLASPGASADARRPRRRRRSADVAQLLDRLQREVRSGAGVRAALVSTLAESPGRLVEVANALAHDRPLVDALAEHRSGDVEDDLVVHALRLGTAHTSALAEVLERTSVVVRERRAWRAERLAQAAQARASARVLTLLPLAFAGWSVLSSPSVRAAYTTSGVVVVLSLIGVILNAIGWWWMRRVIGADR
ncbi:MAG: type II secretion system F family protein [Acidimicrobiales bacterium]|nr:type II secretion system F family protein [Acidimicrobiales bacterium]